MIELKFHALCAESFIKEYKHAIGDYIPTRKQLEREVMRWSLAQRNLFTVHDVAKITTYVLSQLTSVEAEQPQLKVL